MVKIEREKAKEIAQAAWYITEKLGYDLAAWTLAKKREFKEGGLEFTVFMDEDNDSDARTKELSIYVKHDGKQVYQDNRNNLSMYFGTNVHFYRPGEWEKELEALHQKTKRRRRTRQKDSWDFYPGNLLD